MGRVVWGRWFLGGECLGGEFLLGGWVLGGDLLDGLLGLVEEGEKVDLTKETPWVLVGDCAGVGVGESVIYVLYMPFFKVSCLSGFYL